MTPNEDAGPILGVEDVARRLPPRVAETALRRGWAEDIVGAIEALDARPTAERVCAVMAVIEQESGYQANPVVAKLPEIVRDWLKAKLDPLGPLAGPTLKVLLDRKAPGNDQSFAQRIDKLKTERDLDRLYRELAASYQERFPGTYLTAKVLSTLFGPGPVDQMNPVTTAGSMQVKVVFAKTLDDFEDLSDEQRREKLYTRAGGVRAGTARLLGYAAGYEDPIYRFADYNAGLYASRNAAFQEQLAALTDERLTLDGDLLAYDEEGDRRDVETRSLKAMLAFGAAHGVGDWTVRRAARLEKEAGFEETAIWEAVRAAWRAKTGKEPAYARLPEVTLVSPKLSGPRSTAWFAANVKRRYEACLKPRP